MLVQLQLVPTRCLWMLRSDALGACSRRCSLACQSCRWDLRPFRGSMWLHSAFGSFARGSRSSKVQEHLHSVNVQEGSCTSLQEAISLFLSAAVYISGWSHQPNTLLCAVQEREAILRLHSASLPLSADVSLPSLAAACHGYSGADLAAVCREAAVRALSASHPGRSACSPHDLCR